MKITRIPKKRPCQDGEIRCGKGAGGLDSLAKGRKVKASGRTSPFGVRPAWVMIPCIQELEALPETTEVRQGWSGWER